MTKAEFAAAELDQSAKSALAQQLGSASFDPVLEQNRLYQKFVSSDEQRGWLDDMLAPILNILF